MMNGLIITIDGPCGSGKSTLCKRLAARLGYIALDTGAMYRAVALAAYRANCDCEDCEQVTKLCGEQRINFRREAEGERVLLNGEDVSEAIRTPEISLLTSRISSCSGVRRILVRRQQEIGAAGGVVLEGRDTGTVVFPKADVKFFLTADVAERGKRRWLELKARGIAADLESTIAEMQERDRADMNRKDSPLSKADDAVVIDATTLTIEEVLSRMEEIVRVRAAEKGIQ
ncbi:MAG: (d)CMP kinase [bacterium]|nr:(d)CMP kinase [bacterium]